MSITLNLNDCGCECPCHKDESCKCDCYEKPCPSWEKSILRKAFFVGHRQVDPEEFNDNSL